MLSDAWPAGEAQLSTIRSYYQDVVDSRVAAGDARVTQIELAPQSEADGLGCHWHPSVRTNEIMADTMAASLSSLMGW